MWLLYWYVYVLVHEVCTHLCECMCMCVEYIHMCEYVYGCRVFSSVTLHPNFWDKMSSWTRSSPIQDGQQASDRGPPVSAYPALESQTFACGCWRSNSGQALSWLNHCQGSLSSLFLKQEDLQWTKILKKPLLPWFHEVVVKSIFPEKSLKFPNISTFLVLALSIWWATFGIIMD